MSISNRLLLFMNKFSDAFRDSYFNGDMRVNLVASLIDEVDQYSIEDVINAVYLLEKYDILKEEGKLMQWFDPSTYRYTISINDLIKNKDGYYVVNKKQRTRLPEFGDDTIVEDGILENYITHKCKEIAKEIKWPDPEDFCPYNYLVGENMILYKYAYKYLLYPEHESNLILSEYFS